MEAWFLPGRERTERSSGLQNPKDIFSAVEKAEHADENGTILAWQNYIRN